MSGLTIRCRSECLPEALRIVEASFRPAVEEAIAAALSRLRFKTARRENGSEASIEAEIAVLTEELTAYPADVAVSVLKDWPDDAHNPNAKWWPVWSELKERLDRACTGRRYLKAALVRAMQSAGVKPEQLGLKPETEEHRAKVVEECLRKFAESKLALPPEPGRKPKPFLTEAQEKELAQERLDQRAKEGPPKLYFSSPELQARYGKPTPEEDEPMEDRDDAPDRL